MRYQLVRDILLSACCVVLGYSLGRTGLADAPPPRHRKCPRAHVAAPPPADFGPPGHLFLPPVTSAPALPWNLSPRTTGKEWRMSSAAASALTPATVTVTLSGFPTEVVWDMFGSTIAYRYGVVDRTCVLPFVAAPSNPPAYVSWPAWFVRIPTTIEVSVNGGAYSVVPDAVLDVFVWWSSLDGFNSGVSIISTSTGVDVYGNHYAKAARTPSEAVGSAGAPQFGPYVDPTPTPNPWGTITVDSWQ